LIRTSSIDKGEGETLASVKDHSRVGFAPEGVVATTEDFKRLIKKHLENLLLMFSLMF
jgi:hypothetical protein